MTDRYHGFVVTLQDDVRSDDADDLIKALSMVKGVISVRPNVGDGMLGMATDRVKHRYYMAMHDAVRGVFEDTSKQQLVYPPPMKKRFMEPWQWSAIFFISLAVALAIVVVGVHIKDARVEALQKMEKACAGH